jgi:hypothetical protein
MDFRAGQGRTLWNHARKVFSPVRFDPSANDPGDECRARWHRDHGMSLPKHVQGRDLFFSTLSAMRFRAVLNGARASHKSFPRFFPVPSPIGSGLDRLWKLWGKDSPPLADESRQRSFGLKIFRASRGNMWLTNDVSIDTLPT